MTRAGWGSRVSSDPSDNIRLWSRPFETANVPSSQVVHRCDGPHQGCASIDAVCMKLPYFACSTIFRAMSTTMIFFRGPRANCV